MIVDGEVDELPAGAIGGALAIASDPMPWAPEAAQLLDVQMQQVPGLVILVAIVRASRLKLGQPVQPGAAHQPGNGAQADRQGQCDLAVGLALTAQRGHLGGHRWWGGMRTADATTTSVCTGAAAIPNSSS